MTAKARRRPAQPSAVTRVDSVPLGSVVRYPDGRVVMLTADLHGGRMGRVGSGDLGHWIAADAEVELVTRYEPRVVASGEQVDPLIGPTDAPADGAQEQLR